MNAVQTETHSNARVAIFPFTKLQWLGSVAFDVGPHEEK